MVNTEANAEASGELGDAVGRTSGSGMGEHTDNSRLLEIHTTEHRIKSTVKLEAKAAGARGAEVEEVIDYAGSESDADRPRFPPALTVSP